LADGSKTEKLMSALINKMESMDSSLNDLKTENAELKKMMLNPGQLLKRAGFVSVRTPLSEDVGVDAFRADMGLGDASDIVKAEGVDFSEYTNEQVAEMSWSDIHEMAEQSKSTEVVN
tara:strand:+ start:2589 stop:2942 length:354 start_codon:yes stop_codon:yes gene_type:complete